MDEEQTILHNKRHVLMLPKFPELAELHKCVNMRCILDGELVVMVDGKPSFNQVLKRSLMANPFKIELESKATPATFIVYDVLYYQDEQINARPLIERKQVLNDLVIEENANFAVSLWQEGIGTSMFQLAQKEDLEGIVAKRKNSRYYFGKRTKEWIKIKNLLDDDYVVCGYIHKDNRMTSLVLGQYKDDVLLYRGHVTLGISRDEFKLIERQKKLKHSPILYVPKGHGNERAIWVEPTLVCKVQFLAGRNSVQQKLFGGLRFDKEPEECVVT